MSEKEDGNFALNSPLTGETNTETNRNSESSKKDEELKEGTLLGSVGTYMPFLLVILSTILSIILYSHSDKIYLSSFDDYCDQYKEGSDDNLFLNCKSNSAVLRISCALTCTFAFHILVTLLHQKAYDSYWSFKFSFYVAMIIGFFWIDGSHFGTDGYAWYARIMAFIFIILQQTLLIDMAYTWNEKLTDYALKEKEEYGTNYWLILLFTLTIIFYAGTIIVIALLYLNFDQCDVSTLIISLTLVSIVILSVVQLFSEYGSILVSSIISLYASYICYSAITLNPNESCNPTLDTGYQTLSSAIGISIALLSLWWTVYNTVYKIEQFSLGNTESKDGEAILKNSEVKPLLLQVSFVFVLVASYYAMSLTNWATLQSGNKDMSNPNSGTASMWMQASAQWIAVALYFWTLVAPYILTNRDFSSNK